MQSNESPEANPLKSKLDSMQKQLSQNITQKSESQREILQHQQIIAGVEKKNYEAIINQKKQERILEEKKCECEANLQMIDTLNTRKLEIEKGINQY